MLVWDNRQEVVPTINEQGWVMPSYLEWIEKSDSDAISVIKSAKEAASRK